MNIVVIYKVVLIMEADSAVLDFGHEIIGVYKEDSENTKAIIDKYTNKEHYFVEYTQLENL